MGQEVLNHESTFFNFFNDVMRMLVDSFSKFILGLSHILSFTLDAMNHVYTV